MRDTASVLYANQSITTVSHDMIERLKKMALETPLKRARLCLHLSPADAVQEMVIVLHKNSYIRPHRHQNKTESFHMIEGAVTIGFFEDSGTLMETVQLQAGRDPFLYRLSAGYWHTVIPMTEFAVFHEVTTGPFSSSEYPAWEPENRPEAIRLFQNQVLGVL